MNAPCQRPRLSEGGHTPGRDRRVELLALASQLRPGLHRYCAGLMGSVIDGEALCRTLSLEPSSPWTSCARSRHSVPGCSGFALAREIAGDHGE
jgi:hypothetical protein